MRTEISAKDLPKYIGKTIYLHDEESKKDEVIPNIQFRNGWAEGITHRGYIAGVALNYDLTKIFVDL